MVVSGFYRKCEQLKDIRHHQDTNDPRCYYNILQKYFLLKSGNGSNFLDKVIGKKCT